MSTATDTLHLVNSDNGTVIFTINKGKSHVKRKLNAQGTFSRKNNVYQVQDNQIVMVGEGQGGQGALAKAIPATVQPVQSEFPINDRFGFMESFVNMVLDNVVPSTIVAGEGGLGKTHTVMEQLEKRGLVEDKDFVVVKGYSTPKALYCTLFDHNNKIIIFDDCDSILKDPTSINILKGALDSYAVRKISWLSKGFVEDEYPSSFEFKGQVIFISNMSIHRMDGAVKSRSIVVDLSMTLEDKIERMRHILPNILPSIELSTRQKALEFIEEHASEAKELNMRTLQKAINVVHYVGVDKEEMWNDQVKYLLTNV